MARDPQGERPGDIHGKQNPEDVSPDRTYPKTASHQNSDRAKTDDPNQVAGDRHEDGTPRPGSEEERLANEAKGTGAPGERDPKDLQAKQNESQARRNLGTNQKP